MDCALLLLSLWALAGTVSLQTSGSCPERLLGDERRRTCPRHCKDDKDCGSKRQCLCDGQCGLSCVAPGRTCPWPLASGENSAAHLLSPTHSFSALLEVRCTPGFSMPNGLDATIRRCQGDRQWSGDEPVCTGGFEFIRKKEKTILTLLHPHHTEAMNIWRSGFNILSFIQREPHVEVSDGQGTNKAPRRRRGRERQTGIQKRNPSVTGTTDTLHNWDLFSSSPYEAASLRVLGPAGSWSHPGDSFCLYFKDVNQGYDSQLPRRVCTCRGTGRRSLYILILTSLGLRYLRQPSETQSAEPAAAQTCPLPEEVIDTFSIQGDATVGTFIRYSCLSGADIVGSSENFCQDNQTWQDPHPICKKVYCQPLRDVEQGYVVAVQKTEYEVGFDIHYLCKKNFLLDGPQKVTCLSNGSWSGSPPYCRARCLIPAERSRVMIGGVKRWPFDVTDAMVPHGEKVAFYCKHPPKACSFTAIQTCSDGKLEPPACYQEPTWLQFKLFPHRLISEIEECEHADVEGRPRTSDLGPPSNTQQ
ncbi:beta-2-glycoprotein 1-like [Pleuronectes platessa]|uniref:beta-2-glycoprotein 1-like n=1 Tax=Pleuronectes platessa TaxID=8262 RepID=UPI00232A327A|nr:beta-2-glycoprotein 1-like [Pleuronectes platessa]